LRSGNAVQLGPDGRLQGDMFDGEGFVRGVRRKSFELVGARSLVVGCGVGSAIAASLAAAGVAALGLYGARAESAGGRWRGCNEDRDDRVSEGGSGARVPVSGRQRHAVRPYGRSPVR
jgi:shikimate 5-dehydrogenase